MRMRINLLFLAVLSWVLLHACMSQEQQEQVRQNSEPQSVDITVNVGGDSRAERFLGTFDQISRLSLDIDRKYGNKRVLTDFPLEHNGSKWTGTVNKLIVGFDYTITGHAYKNDNSSGYNSSDNNSFIEIFRGDTHHTVTEGTNSLNLRLSPLLDDRELTVPRITRINRPFQMVASTSDNITVSVDTVKKDGSSAVDAILSYRFRSVDNDSLPLDNITGGSFSPASGDVTKSGSSYPDISTTYTAPDNDSTMKLQVRVSNELEIGVTSHFNVYVTDDIDTQNTVDTNPVIENISAERLDNGDLKWTMNVSNDDGFNGLKVKWEYLFGEQRIFTDESNVVNTSDSNRGVMQATISSYQDSDDGMLLITVCEDGGSAGIPYECAYMNEASTSISMELIPGAYNKPIICDGNNCSFDYEGSWIACDTNNKNPGGDDSFATSRITMSIGSGKLNRTVEYLENDNGNCSGDVGLTLKMEATVTDNGSKKYVTLDSDNVSASIFELNMTSVKLSFNNLRYVNGLKPDNETYLCGESYWTGVEHEVKGCNFKDETIPSLMKGITYVTDNNSLRIKVKSEYPDSFGCSILALESTGNYLYPTCTSSSSSSDAYFTYLSRTSGYQTCEDAGKYTITSESACKNAISYLNLNNAMSLEFDGDDEGEGNFPHGCYDDGDGEIWINNYPNSTRNFESYNHDGILCFYSSSEDGGSDVYSQSSSLSDTVRISNLSSPERNYFGQDGTESDGYTTVTLAVNGDNFTGTTVRTGSWALSDEWGDITYQIRDNFAYASNYEDMPWEVTHNSSADSLDVTMKDGSSIDPNTVFMTININSGISVLTEDIQGVSLSISNNGGGDDNYMYLSQTSGYQTCEDAGKYTITSESECENAVSYLDSNGMDTEFEGNDGGDSEYPHGCYDDGGEEIWFNNFPNSTQNFENYGHDGILCSSSPPPRFLSDSNAPVIWDNDLNLVWSVTSFGPDTWSNAFNYCSSEFSASGFSQGTWRLPNTEELQSLADESNYPKIASVFIDNTSTTDKYWSDNNSEYNNWHIAIGYDAPGSTYSTSDYDNLVYRCVVSQGDSNSQTNTGTIVLLAGGAGGSLFESSDLGMNWTELYTDENSYFYNGDYIENGGGFILGGSGYIIRGNSDLSNFESQYLGNGVNGIANDESTQIAIVTYGGESYWFGENLKSDFDENSWNKETVNYDGTDVFGVGQGDGIYIAGGRNGKIWKYDYWNSNSWSDVTPQNSSVSSALEGVAFDYYSRQWFVAGGNSLLTSYDDGNTWSEESYKLDGCSISRMKRVEDGTIWGAGSKSIFKIKDGQASCTHLSWLPSTLRSIDCYQGICLAVGRDGLVIISDDNGETWNESNSHGFTDQFILSIVGKKN